MAKLRNLANLPRMACRGSDAYTWGRVALTASVVALRFAAVLPLVTVATGGHAESSVVQPDQPSKNLPLPGSWSALHWVLDMQRATPQDIAEWVLQPRARRPLWPKEWPWTSVGRINITTVSQRSRCTGTLVGPHTVLTAAHCLFDPRLKKKVAPEQIHFVAGLAPGLINSGHSVAVSYSIPDGYKPRWADEKPDYRAGQLAPESTDMEHAKNDWAVLMLKDDMGLKPIPIKVPPSTVAAEDGLIVVPAYGEDRPELMSVASGCAVSTEFQPSGSLLHTCGTALGNSGAPVLLLTRDNVVLVGIVNGASPAPRGHIANGGIGASASEFAETVAAAADAK